MVAARTRFLAARLPSSRFPADDHLLLILLCFQPLFGYSVRPLTTFLTGNTVPVSKWSVFGFNGFVDFNSTFHIVVARLRITVRETISSDYLAANYWRFKSIYSSRISRIKLFRPERNARKFYTGLNITRCTWRRKWKKSKKKKIERIFKSSSANLTSDVISKHDLPNFAQIQLIYRRVYGYR